MFYFRDNSGLECTFEAIALIEHQGQMTKDGEGQGHYICDVKTKENDWYRTNDNKSHIQIAQKYVSKKSVVVLYRKKTI
jgi:ubiquitin C-terminal hydrolase